MLSHSDASIFNKRFSINIELQYVSLISLHEVIANQAQKNSYYLSM